MRKRIINFINSSKAYPIQTGIASGLYPLLYYYNANFTLVNSWSQLAFFIALFILFPACVFFILSIIANNHDGLKKYYIRILTVFNLGWFSFVILLITIGLRNKILFIIITLLAVALGIVVYKQLKKIVVFQFLLAFIGLTLLIPNLVKHITYSKEWIDQPDDILNVKFEQSPNIYMIQVDGYANFSELDKGYYNFDNTNFNEYLKDSGFKLYEDYRSNYYSTLSSNSSMLGMKHHYYNAPKKGVNELYNSRDIIVGKNPVVSIFKNNNYKTHLILEKSYLLINRPKLEFDYCNIDFSEISYLARGFEVEKDVIEDLELAMRNNGATNNFYFIEKISPGHVPTYDWASKGKEQDRIDYLDKLQSTNTWLKDLIAKIEEKDSNSLIIISADHGGFVGFNYTLETEIKQTDRDLIYSIFTSALAIKWNGKPPEFDDEFKTPVNFFRILFSYLSENEIYLKSLQEDKSFIIIRENAPFGVYEYINENGEVVFNKH